MGAAKPRSELSPICDRTIARNAIDAERILGADRHGLGLIALAVAPGSRTLNQWIKSLILAGANLGKTPNLRTANMLQESPASPRKVVVKVVEITLAGLPLLRDPASGAGDG
ncbi:MAG TPA: hypothetical protein VFU81_00015 [Thermomicrobiales bacterium]|nr:hypothetical protein [Thermomicrobiales bacterium]